MTSSTKATASLKHCILIFLVLQIACDEALPPYDVPEKVFEGSVFAGYQILTPGDNSLKVFVSIKNLFDETLQDRAVLSGSLEIASLRDPRVKKTFSLNTANLLYARSYNSVSRFLTLDTGDSVVF
ncbi:MAG: hypothetical protein ACRDGA_14530, partial [Bacteroidota bacterium]